MMPTAPLELRYKLVLGSGSPRRQELLQRVGLPYDLRVVPVDETVDPSWKTDQVAEHLALQKARAIPIDDHELLLTADTLVLCQGQILGKPKDPAEAVAMLRLLSGNEHDVMTGVCLRTTQKEIILGARTRLEWYHLEPKEIDWYVQEYQPMDKAGAYGIQDWMGLRAVKSIQGCPLNVMGLPLPLVYERLFSEFSIERGSFNSMQVPDALESTNTKVPPCNSAI